MSGVYIMGMEMPKTGEYRCVIRKWGEEITVDLYGDEELCGKLIPVPDHGRLVDADAVSDKIAEEAGEEAGNYVDMDVVGMGLEYTPTIIPADKKGEK